MIKQYSIH